MTEFQLVAQLLLAGLQLWNHPEKEKYVEEILDLKIKWWAEMEKPQGVRDNAFLDRIEFRLRSYANSWAATIALENARNK